MADEDTANPLGNWAQRVNRGRWIPGDLQFVTAPVACERVTSTDRERRVRILHSRQRELVQWQNVRHIPVPVCSPVHNLNCLRRKLAVSLNRARKHVMAIRIVRSAMVVGQESLCRSCRYASIQTGYSAKEEEIRCCYLREVRLVSFPVTGVHRLSEQGDSYCLRAREDRFHHRSQQVR